MVYWILNSIHLTQHKFFKFSSFFSVSAFYYLLLSTDQISSIQLIVLAILCRNIYRVFLENIDGKNFLLARCLVSSAHQALILVTISISHTFFKNFYWIISSLLLPLFSMNISHSSFSKLFNSITIQSASSRKFFCLLVI